MCSLNSDTTLMHIILFTAKKPNKPMVTFGVVGTVLGVGGFEISTADTSLLCDNGITGPSFV